MTRSPGEHRVDIAFSGMAPNSVAMDRIRLLQVRAALDQRKGNWRQAESDLAEAISLASAGPQSGVELVVSMMADYPQLLRKHHQRQEARVVARRAAELRNRPATNSTVDVTELQRKAKPMANETTEETAPVGDVSSTSPDVPWPDGPRHTASDRCRAVSEQIPGAPATQMATVPL